MALVVVGAVGARAIRTEYVPQPKGRAAIGLENGELGVYKNGSFRKLSASDVPLLACSPAAAGCTGAQSHYARSPDSATGIGCRRRSRAINAYNDQVWSGASCAR